MSSKPKKSRATSTRPVTDSPQYVVKHYARQVLDYDDDGYANGYKTVQAVQYGMYKKERREDGTYYMKYSIISRDKYNSAAAKGKTTASEHAGVRRYPEGYVPATTIEGKMLQRGVKIKADSALGIKGKRPTLIKESEINYVARAHNITPETVTSVIQHIDADIIARLAAGKRKKTPVASSGKKRKNSDAGRAFRKTPPRVEIEIVRPSDFIV